MRRDRVPSALLAYATVLGAFLIVPPFLKASVGPPEAFTLQEAADLFTPVVVVPLAWLVLDRTGGLGRAGWAAFVVIAAAWVEGQGIHLAANAIGDAFPDHAAADAFYRTVPGDLDLWLDETLSHWLWHAAWIALSVLFVLASIRAGRHGGERAGLASGIAGAVHGATFFIVTVEGVTTALGIPASIGLLAWSGWLGRRGHGRLPVVAFFVVSTVVTLLGYVAWAALHGGALPEFSKVGLFG